MASNNEEADIDDPVNNGDPYVTGLLLRHYWSQSARLNFQFTIPDAPDDYEATRDFLIEDYPDGNHDGVVPMAQWLKDAIRNDAIPEFLRILPFAITEQGNNDVDTQLRYAVADLTLDGEQPPPPAYAHPPEPDSDGVFQTPGTEQANWMSGDMFFNVNRFTTPREVVTGTGAPAEIVGTYEYHTVLHETGHALGLKHGHEGDPEGFDALPADRDSMEFTVMTYRSFIGQSDLTSYKNLAGHYAQTLMMLDIQALQYLYGADYTTRALDTTYVWDPNGTYSVREGALGALVPQWTTDSGVIFLTIWDGNGNDTYDFSAFTTNARIDLAPGGWSNLGSNLADLYGTSPTAPGYDASVDNGSRGTARGNVFNALLHEGSAQSLIENAIAGSGNDRVSGNSAKNRLVGNAGDDTLRGLVGDDTLIGGAGADRLDGGEGFDIAEYSNAVGERVKIKALGLNAAAGEWQVRGPAEASNTLTGAADNLFGMEGFLFGEGDDLITGTARDASFGFYLDGRGGDDVIETGEGRDTLIGGLGTDSLKPGLGIFQVFGGAFLNGVWVESAAQDDVLFLDRSSVADYRLDFSGSPGQAGTFRSTAGQPGGDGSVAQGMNRLNYLGGALGDTVSGAHGDDTIRGGGGTDTITGNLGADRLHGEDGNDEIRAGGGNDSIYGGDGVDNISGDDGNDYIETGPGASINVSGGAGNDTIIGSAENDILNGGLDNDRIEAGDGNDTIFAGDGADTVLGGIGNDSIQVRDYGDNVDGGDGFDVLQVIRSGSTVGSTFVLNGKTSDGTKTKNLESLQYEGGNGDEKVTGGVGNDTIRGSFGADTLAGSDGDDQLSGDHGNDTLLGGLGVDALIGGFGDDRIETGGGNDFSVQGNEGNDTIIGAGGDEQMNGGVDNDSLVGAGGSDILTGGDGTDTLNGGTGNDWLFGGTGADRFVFNANSALDRIADFDADPAGGQDLVDLIAFGFGSFAGMLAAGGALSQQGADARLSLAGGSVVITFASVQAANLDGSDFLFA